jgi:Fe-S-cluster-containing hydrogenase component 2
MGRRLETVGLAEGLMATLDSARWDDVAARCLSCGNCTMVCPTCFCSSVHDESSLDGTSVSRVQRWDSCFTLEHSFIHGGSVRSGTSDRYRQWLTHKLSTWWGQFGESGCVGCGRCISWCPVGIDLVEEANGLLAEAPSVEAAADEATESSWSVTDVLVKRREVASSGAAHGGAARG